MKNKKCINGHLYDYSIYGDKCPFCPASTRPISKKLPEVYENIGRGECVYGGPNNMAEAVRRMNEQERRESVDPTVPVEVMGARGNFTAPISSGRTKIFSANNDIIKYERRMVALLVSYSANPNGEVFGVFEGTNLIGRDYDCDIAFPNDSHMSSKHFLIQYVEAKGVFKAQDEGSSNGSYVNGNVYTLGETIELKPNDVIVLGKTKLLFFPIPQF